MVDRIESNKDFVQELVESTAAHVGRITTIITTAVADVAREIGDTISDGFEMAEAARRARADRSRSSVDEVGATEIPAVAYLNREDSPDSRGFSPR
ncbi:MAG: hypothetical protein QM673_00655 [Gordonia sp. (in: high G+C Gram-positive bacteria)]